LIPPIKDRVLFEDNHFIAVNKCSSEIVQGDKTGDAPMSDDIKKFLKEKYDKPGNVFCGVIHRIDRPVSGVVLFAKTSKGLSRMNEKFSTRDVQKTYWAIVKNKPEKMSGELIHYLIKDEKKNKSTAHTKEIRDSKLSKLSYKVIAESERYFLLEIDPHTGRHHQIRAQLSAMGSPIKGDLKYGFDRSNPDGSISLHARKLTFIHPINDSPIEIIAPVPDDKLWLAFQEMQKK
jgi:23S rRNA pseudouridine1911/1915/1917 synthase